MLFLRCDAVRKSLPSTRKATIFKRDLTIQQLDEQRQGRQRVVILGSGWAGYTLARALNPKRFQTVIVSPRSYFVFTPLLASTSVGTLEFRTALESLRARGTKYEFYQGRAEKIDFASKAVVVRETVHDPNVGLVPAVHDVRGKDDRSLVRVSEEGQGEDFTLPYDRLVICVGSYSQTFGIPGTTEHAFFLKDVQDARKIRTKILSCFETAALPTTPVPLQKNLLHFAVVGGGPTGIEFSAELLDIVRDDLHRFYPQLMEHVRISLFDVSSKILSMFDEKLGQFALEHFAREGVEVKTKHKILSLDKGFPQVEGASKAIGYTLTVQDDETSDVHTLGCGLVVWSTGLMANPFVAKKLNGTFTTPTSRLQTRTSDITDASAIAEYNIRKHPQSGSVVTDDMLRVCVDSAGSTGSTGRTPSLDATAAGTSVVLGDVFALGDCAACESRNHPATAQVASQQAAWLAKRLNRGEMDSCRKGFSFESAGIMAYVGAFNGIVQLGQGKGTLSGRAAFWMWRSVYLTKSMSWRNRLLIPIYWAINSAFGRDISRF